MAVQYIHSKKVLHRDLKAENVFLTKKNVVKIGKITLRSQGRECVSHKKRYCKFKLKDHTGI